MIRERLCQREAMLCETCGEKNGNTPKERSHELEKSTPAALSPSRINIPITFSISDVLFALQEPLKAPRPARTYVRTRVRDREIKVRRFPVPDGREGPSDAPAPRRPSQSRGSPQKNSLWPQQLPAPPRRPSLHERTTVTEALIPRALRGAPGGVPEGAPSLPQPLTCTPAPRQGWPPPAPAPTATLHTPQTLALVGFGWGFFFFLETPILENSRELWFFKLRCCC